MIKATIRQLVVIVMAMVVVMVVPVANCDNGVDAAFRTSIARQRTDWKATAAHTQLMIDRECGAVLCLCDRSWANCQFGQRVT